MLSKDMKERLNMFVKNLINIMIVMIYIFMLYSHYEFIKYDGGFGSIIPLGFMFLFALMLLVWFLTSIVLTIQKIQVQFQMFKYEKIISVILIIVSTGIYLYNVQDIHAKYAEFNNQEYEDTFDVSNILLNDDGITLIDQKVKDIVDDKKVDLYHSYLTCDESNRIQSFSLELLYLNKYIYHLEYDTQKIHVKLTSVSYGEESNQYPSWQTFVDKLKTITFPQTTYTIEFVSSKGDAESLYYELSSSYIKVTPEKIKSDHQTTEQPQTHDSHDDTSFSQTLKPDKRIGKEAGEGLVETEYFIDKNIGFRLRCTDAATGSYFYVLDKTKNGGKNWIYWNNDPFHTELGTAPEVYFMNEKIGFIKMTCSQGDYSHLYRTQDGGKIFEQVRLSGNDDYDYLHVPYLQDNNLYLKVYKHMNAIEDRYIMYVSTDQGKTWRKNN